MDPTIREQNNADDVPTADSGSFGKQLTGVIVAAILVLLLFRFGGLVVAITGVLAFLDAWSAGIRKDASKKSFLNIVATRAIFFRCLSSRMMRS